jgi:hypothetical protein
MNPKNVSPNKFEVIAILFDNSDFSIAYGTCENGKII